MAFWIRAVPRKCGACWVWPPAVSRRVYTLVLGTQARQLRTKAHKPQGYCTSPHSLARNRLVALESLMQSVLESLLEPALALTFESAPALLGMVTLGPTLARNLGFPLFVALPLALAL